MGITIEMEVVKSTCNICPSSCGIEILKDGEKLIKIRGDKESPVSRGFMCIKGKRLLEYAYHPERILHPLRRVGERGEREFKRISWDEAFEIIVSNMERIKRDYGPESFVFIRGSAQGLQDILFTRLAHAFGSPNVTSMGFLCFLPRVYAYNSTFGSFLVPDLDFPPKTIVLWGINPYATYPVIYRKIVQARKKGSKIVVVDPNPDGVRLRADLSIRPRPGSDMALILSLIKLVVSNNLYDREFVETWAYGFDRLKAHMDKLSLENLESVTWVKKDDLLSFLDIYIKNSPSVILEGNALDQGYSPFQTLRALYILEAITGNIGRPGGKIRFKNPKASEKYRPSFTLRNLIPSEVLKRTYGREYLAPFANYSLPQAVVKAILKGSEDAPKGAFIMRGNVVLTWPNTEETLRALKKLDFIFCTDLFFTPTSTLADVILPAKTCLEYDSVIMPPDFPHLLFAQKRVLEIGEARSDIWIINELGKRLALEDYFFRDEYQIYDEILREDGFTFSEFKKTGVLSGEKEYYFFKESGFRTESGKVEIYSERLQALGYSPLPDIYPPAFGENPEFPFILTSYKPREFRHTNFRQIESIRRISPYPKVLMNPLAAEKLKLSEGEWVKLESPFGQIKAKLELAKGIDTRVLISEHGWWLPEKPESYLEYNLNMLTDSSLPGSSVTGSPRLRGIPCRVSKIGEEKIEKGHRP